MKRQPPRRSRDLRRPVWLGNEQIRFPSPPVLHPVRLAGGDDDRQQRHAAAHGFSQLQPIQRTRQLDVGHQHIEPLAVLQTQQRLLGGRHPDDMEPVFDHRLTEQAENNILIFDDEDLDTICHNGDATGAPDAPTNHACVWTRSRMMQHPTSFARLVGATLTTTWLLSVAGTAAAAPPAVQNDGETSTLPCGTESASVFGKRNVITFTGACRGLTVRGDGNHVSVALAPAAPVDIAGSDNQVRVTAGGGGTLQVSGSNTLLVADGGTAPNAAGSRITGDGQTIQLECNASAITLEGNHSRFHVHGPCRGLTLRGTGNVADIELAPGAAIAVEGDGTVVIWRQTAPGAAPTVRIQGTASLVQPESAAQAAAPPAPPPGVTLAAQLMAALQGEVVPEGTRFHLPDAMFAGDTLLPPGQTALAQISQLVGIIHPAALRITGPSVARKTEVQTWLQQRGLVRSPMTIASDQPGDHIDVTIAR